MTRKITCFIVCIVIFFSACGKVPNTGGDIQSLDTSVEETNTITTRVPLKKNFFQEKAYRETLSDVHTTEDITRILTKNYTDGPDVTLHARSFLMILQDKFFLIPTLPESTVSEILLTEGNSKFILFLSDGCKLEINVYHSTADFSSKQGTTFVTDNNISVIHQHKQDEKKVSSWREWYYMQVEGYWVTIYGYDLCGCKQSYINNLTFEKVEIQ